jgi:PEP-CTERM motif
MLVAELAYAAAAPEPSTWAMMLIGLAGLGFAGWRARAHGRAATPSLPGDAALDPSTVGLRARPFR